MPGHGLVPLILVSLVCCLATADNSKRAARITCSYCKDVYSSKYDKTCDDDILCSDNEDCFAGKYVNQEGVTHYTLSCKPHQYCEIIKRFPTVGKRQLHDNVYICQQCCSSTKCNRHLCQ
ncbi:uncharacterized protein LOC124143468 isoform X3 [Haliotis rufescens]|uniref:uncharacterized protein LOC124143468 isoform X1 n=1 Tax=Haliotis rufescens TaxID=6454 RepID=UPI001EB03DEB|nr:uncharacterized protein LOC124143468 isoform X1 [Haliotis rufescens]XP_046368412.1 uncharacterized protein LOC124143468 isoform X3 [Haliotis rufescens]